MADTIWCDTKVVHLEILDHELKEMALFSRKDYNNSRSRLVFKRRYEQIKI